MLRLNGVSLTVALTLVVGCGGSDKAPAGAGQQASVAVTASAGGMVALGSAALTIPPGSLAGDTTITVKTAAPGNVPEAGTVKGLVYDFGPDGTTFSVPAALSLPMVGTPGVGQAAVVSWLNTSTNAWEDLPTTSAAGMVTAQVPHFTSFVVRFTGVATLDCAFSECGGDIAGDWTIQGACIDKKNSDNPFGQSCPEATFDLQVDATGSVTFGADKTYSSSINLGGKVHVVFPAKCASAFPGGLMTCAQLAMTLSKDGTVTCTGTPATNCDCTGPIESKVDNNSGTYEVSGSTLTMIDSVDLKPDVQQFCVKGTELKVHNVEDDGSTATWIGKRK